MKCPECKGSRELTRWEMNDPECGVRYSARCPTCEGTGQVSVPCGSLPSWSVGHLRQTLSAMEAGQRLEWRMGGDVLMDNERPYRFAGEWLACSSHLRPDARVTVEVDDSHHYINAIMHVPDHTAASPDIDYGRRSRVIVEIGEEVEE